MAKLYFSPNFLTRTKVNPVAIHNIKSNKTAEEVNKCCTKA